MNADRFEQLTNALRIFSEGDTKLAREQAARFTHAEIVHGLEWLGWFSDPRRREEVANLLTTD